MLTGEPVPVEKTPGSRVTGGTVNGTGSFMQAERVGSETLLAQIVRMVSEPSAPVPRSSAWRTRSRPILCRRSSPSPPSPSSSGASSGRSRLAYALVNAVAVLIIACPCALGLATPMSIMVATGRGAMAGILIKNAEALEVLERVDTLVVDKPGRSPKGSPAVSVVAGAEQEEKALLRLAASLEQGSEHPLAAAIVAGAQEREHGSGSGLARSPARASSASWTERPWRSETARS